MFAEAMRDTGYASYRDRLHTLWGIPEDDLQSKRLLPLPSAYQAQVQEPIDAAYGTRTNRGVAIFLEFLIARLQHQPITPFTRASARQDRRQPL